MQFGVETRMKRFLLNKQLNKKLIVINILLIIVTIEVFIQTAIFDLVLIGSILIITLAILLIMNLVIYLKTLN